MVGASHGNVARVKELLARRPALARVSWDWGYGDWETALGAASHVGASAGVQGIRGPHGITLLAHAEPAGRSPPPW